MTTSRTYSRDTWYTIVGILKRPRKRGDAFDGWFVDSDTTDIVGTDILSRMTRNGPDPLTLELPITAALAVDLGEPLAAGYLAEDRARCRICGRRLRSTPWKYLGIGPVCVKKYHGSWRNGILYYRDRFIDRRTKLYEVEEVNRQVAELDKVLARQGFELTR